MANQESLLQRFTNRLKGVRPEETAAQTVARQNEALKRRREARRYTSTQTTRVA